MASIEVSKSQPIAPSDDDLGSALKSLRDSHPSTGAAKLLPLLLDSNPAWTVSEKRLRKVLQKQGLTLSAPVSRASPAPALHHGSGDDLEYPTSQIVPSLDPSIWSRKVAVKYFGPKKGKGLIAREPIDQNETIWIEDPLLWAAEGFVAHLASTGLIVFQLISI